METLKTAVIVVLLLAVLYGVYLVLNKPDPTPPGDLAWEAQAMQPLQLELDEEGSDASSVPGHPTAEMPPPVDGLLAPPAPGAVPAPDLVDESIQQETVAPPSAPAWTAESSPSDVATGPERPDWRSEADWSSMASPEPPPTEALADGNQEKNGPLAPDSVYSLGSDRAGWPLPTENDPTEAEGTEDETTAPEMSAVEPATPPVPAESPSEPPRVGSSIVENALQSAQARIAEQQLYDALLTLSMVYGNPDLGDEDSRRLLDLMDPLAGKVIYSGEHLMDGPHKVARGETLADIAEKYQVPWQLLANVNGIAKPESLEPGTELKVIRGPFRAEINLQRTELTVYAGRLYAGRFPVTLGSDPAPQPGDYRVFGKQPGRTYYAGDGRTIPTEDSTNPYGEVWIDLGGDLCIHGSSDRAQPGQGCISLSPLDANDVYGILSKGSAVTILR